MSSQDPFIVLKPSCITSEKILAFALSRRDGFHPTPLLHYDNGVSEMVENLEIRRSQSLVSSEVDRLIHLVFKDVLLRNPGIEERLGIPKIRWPHTTGSCIVYNDGDYVLPHDDTVQGVFGERRIGSLYYFHRHPKRFTGGEFILYLDGKKFVIEPEDGSLVIFPVNLTHEVYPVSSPSKHFEDGRFVLAGFLWEAGSLLKASEIKIRKLLGPYSSYPPLRLMKRAIRKMRPPDYHSPIKHSSLD